MRIGYCIPIRRKSAQAPKGSFRGHPACAEIVRSGPEPGLEPESSRLVVTLNATGSRHVNFRVVVISRFKASPNDAKNRTTNVEMGAEVE